MIAVAVAGVIGLSALFVFDTRQATVTDWLLARLAEPSSAVWIVVGTVLLLALPLVALAIHVFLVGQRVAVARRFPPPGHAVIRDTRIVTGSAAERRGRLLKMLSLALLAALCAASIVTASILFGIAAALQQGT